VEPSGWEKFIESDADEGWGSCLVGDRKMKRWQFRPGWWSAAEENLLEVRSGFPLGHPLLPFLAGEYRCCLPQHEDLVAFRGGSGRDDTAVHCKPRYSSFQAGSRAMGLRLHLEVIRASQFTPSRQPHRPVRNGGVLCSTCLLRSPSPCLTSVGWCFYLATV
jgi:hypothetical protein